MIVRELMPTSGHRDTSASLDSMLRDEGVPALSGVDTRFLTRQVRMHGVVPAALAVGPAGTLPSEHELRSHAASLDYDAIDFVMECSTEKIVWHPPAQPGAPRIALVDYGAKQAMLEHLLEGGAGVWLVPATMTAGEILALQPDAVLLSNGPGDPSRLDYAVETVRGLLEGFVGTLPIFGICLGHQLLALAAGGRTVKMRFGHRGVNQPIIETATGRMSVTTQNHGYMVDPASIPSGYRVTHTNLNDGSVEGIAHLTRPVWGVQWHPEAHPGPYDSLAMIDHLLDLARSTKVEERREGMAHA